MDHRLRVASYNLRDLKDDAEAAARVVRAVSPDVLCLQEVPRRLLSSHRTALFAARCGLFWAGDNSGSGGTTIMSSLRLDVADSHHSRLKVRRFQRQRGYAASHIRLPHHRPIQFVSMHLSLDPDERATHVADVLRMFAGEDAVVLAGDLNEGSDGNAWQALARAMPIVTGDELTFPAADPRHRIDVIFASPTLPLVPGSPVELDRADLVAATDHLPVWADLDISALALS